MNKLLTTTLIASTLLFGGCMGSDDNKTSEPVTYTPKGTPMVEAPDPLVQLLMEDNNDPKNTNSENMSDHLLEKEEFLAKAKELNGTIIDLRTPGEIEEIPMLTPETLNFNTYDFENFGKNMATLDKSKPTFIYCAHAIRSSDVYAMMIQAGFEEVYELKGGVDQ